LFTRDISQQWRHGYSWPWTWIGRTLRICAVLSFYFKVICN
jgi:hypothetical protein